MDYEKDEREISKLPGAPKTCKDCYYNGRCEFQDAPPSGRFTQEEIENTSACNMFKPKEDK
jgi:hypothetical protein